MKAAERKRYERETHQALVELKQAEELYRLARNSLARANRRYNRVVMRWDRVWAKENGGRHGNL